MCLDGPPSQPSTMIAQEEVQLEQPDQPGQHSTNTAHFGRPRMFTRKMTLWLTPAQEDFLHTETERRRKSGETSKNPAAHGGNSNINRGMLIREALEEQFGITRQANRKASSQ